MLSWKARICGASQEFVSLFQTPLSVLAKNRRFNMFFHLWEVRVETSALEKFCRLLEVIHFSWVAFFNPELLSSQFGVKRPAPQRTIRLNHRSSG